jgi:hypothetical protein
MSATKKVSTLQLFTTIIFGALCLSFIGMAAARVYADDVAPKVPYCDPKIELSKQPPCQGYPPVATNKADPATSCTASSCDLIKKYLNPIVTFLVGVPALVATISLVIGGIQYGSSADDPQKVAAAKSRMYNAILGLLGFVFLWSFLQFIMPGGVFTN